MRSKLLVLLLVSAVLSIPAVAQNTNKTDDLASLEKLYQEKVAKLNEKYADLLVKASSDYTNALTALERTLAKKGDLEGVVAVRGEQDRFKAGQEIPEEAVVKTPAELKTLQETFRNLPATFETERKSAVSKVATTYIGKLEQMKAGLTKEMKIEEALLVRKVIEKVKGSVDDLATLQKAYQDQVAKIETKYAEQLNKMGADYTNALATLEQTFVKQGNLDAVVAVRTERDRFKTAQEIPEEAVVKTPAELKTFQEKFQSLLPDIEAGKEKEIAKVASAYVPKLEQLKKSLTQDGKVDEALLVKAEIDKVRDNVDLEPERGDKGGSDKIESEAAGKTPAALRKGLVLYYSFTLNESGKVTDASGNGHTGAASGATWVTNGITGGAYSFDGINDYVQVPGNSSLSPPTVTVAAWIRRAVTGTRHEVSSKWHNSYGGYELWINAADGCLRFSCGNATSSPPNYGKAGGYGAGTVADTSWHHVVGTFSGSVAATYIDGSLASSDSVSFTLPNRQQTLIIGAQSEPATFGQLPFSGWIDEVRIYNRALTAEEVTMLYKSTQSRRTGRKPSPR